MKRFVKNNITLIIVVSLSLIAAIALLVWTVIEHTQMSRYIKKTNDLRTQIGKLIEQSPAPVDENIPRIKADARLYSKVSREMMTKFGHPFQPAMDKFIATLQPKTSYEELRAKFREGWDSIDSTKIAEQGIYFKSFQRNYPNWSEAVNEFRKLIEKETQEPLNDNAVNEILLSQLGVPRNMQNNPDLMLQFMVGYRNKLIDMLSEKMVLSPEASFFSFGGRDVYNRDEYPLIPQHWDVIGDLMSRLVKSGVTQLNTFAKRSLEGEDVGEFKVFHYSFEVVGSMENIRNLVTLLDQANVDNRMYVVRSIFLYAQADPAATLFNPTEVDVFELMKQEEAANRDRENMRQGGGMMGPGGMPRNTRSNLRPNRGGYEERQTEKSDAEKLAEFQAKLKAEDERQKQLPYNERRGYGNILINAQNTVRAIIDVDYVMQNSGK